LRDGGLRETVIEGETGAFYETSDPAELARVIREFDTTAIDPAACRESAMRFDRTRFEAGLRREVALAQEEPAARAARSERLRAPRRVIPRGRSRA
ncbi:MAG: hypothetical protein ACEQSX_15225, partial [Baekduiaceae bacterium]